MPSLQQLASWIRVTVGPLVLPASGIPQIFTDHKGRPLQLKGAPSLRSDIQDTRTPLPPSHCFCRSQGLQAQHQLPLGHLAEQKSSGPPSPWLPPQCEPRTEEEGRMGWAWDERDIMVTGVFCHQGHLNCKTDGFQLYHTSWEKPKALSFPQK